MQDLNCIALIGRYSLSEVNQFTLCWNLPHFPFLLCEYVLFIIPFMERVLCSATLPILAE